MQPDIRTEIPGPRAKAAMARGRFDMQAAYRTAIIDDVASSSTYLVDIDGNTYLDLFANFALGALGYNHPNLLAVVRSDAFAHASANPTSTPFVTTPSWLDFMDTLEARFAPHGMSKVFCVDAGGEGVESALKAAFIVHGEARREARGLPRDPLALPDEHLQEILANNAGSDAVIVSFGGGFHGRGLGPLSATHSKAIHKADLPSFHWPHLPFPAKQFPEERHAEDNAAREEASLQALEGTLDRYAGRVAAIIVEPLQSEGGDRQASATFFKRVQQMAQQAGAALIFDEVQTGMGSSGTLWAHEQFELPSPPDLMTFGKKMQLGGFFAAQKYDIQQFGRMFQTRNGDRARAMLGQTILETIASDSLLDNVRTTGAYFLQRLREFEQAHPALVSQARGWGFMLAFDLPTPQLRNDFVTRCLHHGVFITYTGTQSVRLRPHLITLPAQVDQAMVVFEQVIRELA
ncbi:MAG: aminotransferase class III-fold pyridoxal phosphate-dependent enzyme [Gammaproteobacteria bacterium]|nr:aminotransferase class III-fold pyridoxal phosphate-dependent enzyme [Gammaproteobacteria bacterium]